MLNFDVLDAAISYAAGHPDEFYMQAWFKRADCGTTACLAGTIAVQAGWEPTGWSLARANGEPPNGETRTSQVVKDGRNDAVSAVAADILGLNPVLDHRIVDSLFHAANLAEVIRLRNRYAADASVPERVWSLPR